MLVRVDRLIEALEAPIALLDGEEQRALARRLVAASRDPLHRALLDVLRETAEAVSAAGEGLAVDVAYRAEGAEIVVTRAEAAEPAEDLSFAFDRDDIERLTVRLPAELKEIAAHAAAQAGLSLNGWLTRVVSREAARPPRRGEPGGGDSLRGWVGR